MKNIPSVSNRELEILQVIWQSEGITALETAQYFQKPENGGYNKNTTYTFLNRMVEKGVIERREPNFRCVPLYRREDIVRNETKNFIDRVYEGSFQKLFAQFAEEALSEEDILELERLIEKKRGESP